MSKEVVTNRENLSDIDKIKLSIDILKNKKNRIMFFVPELGATPSGAVYEIYFNANILKNMGYEVKILLESEKSKIPDYVEKELVQFEHIAMDTVQLTVSAEDLLIIPEIFTNVMEKTKGLPCMRVVLLQSIDNALRALVPGIDWSTFGITDVITTSNIMDVFINEFFTNAKYKIRTYNVHVPNYFKKRTSKRPVVSVFVRNENDLEKVIKLFYQKFPQFRFVTFEPMQTDSKPPKFLKRKDFADKLSRNFAALWIDRLASHAQFPLECMKVGTVPISLKPDITPEYIIDKDDKFIENSGVWTSDVYALPSLLADTLRKFLEDEIPQELFDTMDSIVANYSPEVATTQLTNIYGSIFSDRMTQFETTLKALEAKQASVVQIDTPSLSDELLNG